MQLNRREFIKAAMAAAVVAHVPFTEAEAVEAFEAFGIQDMGNGWFRCSVTCDAKKQTLSAFMKRKLSRVGVLSHGKVRAYFNLETGEIGKVQILADESEPTIEAEKQVIVYGMQLESTP